MAFNAVSAKNALLEADLTVSNQQHQDAEHEIKRIQIEKEQLINQIRREYKQEKDVWMRYVHFIECALLFSL